MTTREKLIAQAEADHAKHPQYKGYFDKWVLATVTKRVRTKLGTAFEKGDVVLANPARPRTEKAIPRGKADDLPYEQWPEVALRECYSFRNKCLTLVDASHVELAEVPA